MYGKRFVTGDRQKACLLMSLEKKRDTVSRRVSLDEINNNFNAR